MAAKLVAWSLDNRFLVVVMGLLLVVVAGRRPHCGATAN